MFLSVQVTKMVIEVEYLKKVWNSFEHPQKVTSTQLGFTNCF